MGVGRVTAELQSWKLIIPSIISWYKCPEKPAVCYLEHGQWLVANTAAATDQPKSRCGFHP